MNKALPRVPGGCSLLVSCQEKTGKQLWWIWECDSISEIKHYFDHFIAPFSTIEYHELDEKHSKMEKHHYKKAS
ncbi:MAG: hypothetical protein K9M07_00745 [Simkaniaceae bacterium]|nr:hypothetical protein [Simkaniaceae bacterium]